MVTKKILESALLVTREELKNDSESTDFKRGIRFAQATLYGELIKAGKMVVADTIFMYKDMLSV